MEHDQDIVEIVNRIERMIANKQTTPIVSAINNQMTWVAALGFVTSLLLVFIYNDYNSTKNLANTTVDNLAVISQTVDNLSKSEKDRTETAQKTLELINEVMDKITNQSNRIDKIEYTRFDNQSAKDLEQKLVNRFERDIADIRADLNSTSITVQELQSKLNNIEFIKRDVDNNTTILKAREEIVNTVRELERRVQNMENK